MRKLVLSILVICSTVLAFSQPPEGEAKPGESYGEKITTEGAVPLSEVAMNLKGTEAIDAKIIAKIIEVCPKKGCWLKLEVNETTTAFVKMKDYGFFLPLAAKGKTVVLDGQVKMKTTSVAELKHYAEDAKKSKEEIDKITKPEKEISVLAKGIVIVE